MAADLQTLLDGFATVLDAIDGANVGLRGHAQWPDSVIVPCAIPELVDYAELDLAGSDLLCHFDVFVLTQLGSMKYGQANLIPYASAAGAQSVRAALLTDGNLNGAADCINSVRLRHFGTITVSEIVYTGCIFRVEVVG